MELKLLIIGLGLCSIFTLARAAAAYDKRADDLSEDDRDDSVSGSGSGEESSDDTTGDTTGSEDSTSGSCSPCPNVRRLLKQGCTRGCVYVDSGCPACNSTCVMLDEQGDKEDECSSSEPCEMNQVCLAAGPFGQRRCVDLLTEGMECGRSSSGADEDEGDEDSEDSYSDDESSSSGKGRGRARERIGGASDRYAVGRTGDASVGCAEGLVCARVNPNRKECRQENSESPCVQARAEDTELSCDEDGYYDSLQCNQVENSTLYQCYCASRDGVIVEGSEETVDDPDDGPDCDDEVYKRCEYEVGGVEYSVHHGEDYLLPNNCSRCQCEDGEPAFCQALDDCSPFVGGGKKPVGCEVEGVELAHGETFEVDCNRCGCRNGKITCTNRKCEDDDDSDEGLCQSCRKQPRSPVCAPDGRTYHSACYAINCLGHLQVDLRRGACASYDVCEDYECPEDGQVCIPTGGRYCFSRDGCDPDELRICVDPDELMCEDDGEDEEGSGDGAGGIVDVPGPEGDGENPEEGGGGVIGEPEVEGEGEEDEEEEDYVCGTNCLSYSSVCHLIQDTAGTEQVAYAGKCNRPTCKGGPVCGTDGVTYDNRCVLRGRSSVRLDYEGACVPDSDPPVNVEEQCVMVSRARRCFYNVSNCRHLVRPEEGCCALCGGIIFVAIDFAGLSDYIRINPRLRTLDALIETLVRDGFIPAEVTARCELEAQVTSTGIIEISLSARDEDADSEFCNLQSQQVADAIDSPTVAIPDVLQFAGAAVAAPTQQQISGGEGEEDGAPPLVVLSSLTLLVGLFLSVVLL